MILPMFFAWCDLTLHILVLWGLSLYTFTLWFYFFTLKRSFLIWSDFMPSCSALFIHFMISWHLHKAVKTYFIIDGLTIEYDTKYYRDLDVFAIIELQIVHHNLKITGLKVIADMRDNHQINWKEFMYFDKRKKWNLVVGGTGASTDTQQECNMWKYGKGVAPEMRGRI